MKNAGKLLLASITAGALVLAGTSAASASAVRQDPTHLVSANVTANDYSDRDVIEFLAFGSDELAAEAPPAELVDDILAGVTEVNPEFHNQVTEPLQSGDPVAVEAALTTYNDSMIEYVRSSDEWAVGSDEDGTATAYCLVWPLALAVALVVAVVSTRIVAYVGPSTPSATLASDDRLTRQEASAAIASVITP
jgi:SdpC family antimicrobial peptide